jgi:septum formation protein
MKIILASGSAARQTMLRNAGLEFSTIASDTDEPALRAGSSAAPADLALMLASAKAANVAALAPKALTIGADQILLCDGKIYNKPKSLEDAAMHLRALSGRSHTLITAACIYQGTTQIWHHTGTPSLTMRTLSEADIASYIEAAGPKILTSVGAYQLEGLGINLFTDITGDFFTILGLPLLPLLAFLRAHAAQAAPAHALPA